MAEHDPDKLTFEKIPMDVTIFFIDIQGFSKITENYDQRLVNDMVERHFSRYLEIMYQHEGEVNETSGDGLMVIFKENTPEINARKAVQAGLRVVSENNRLNKEREYPWGAVNLHLGINTGEALVGSTKMTTITGDRWTYTASGLVTILAARIGALSSETKLYVGPRTYNCVKARYDCEFKGTHEVKNINEPVPVYWVKAAHGGG
jgi:class 3 adenylate cyclase